MASCLLPRWGGDRLETGVAPRLGVGRAGVRAVPAAARVRATRGDGSLAPTDADGVLRAVRLASDVPQTRIRSGRGVHSRAPDAGRSHGRRGLRPRAALAVVREQAGSVGEELVGFAPLILVAFVPLVGACAADAVAVAFVFALTLAYGLFYYGTAMFFGARHLFPAAPFLWLLSRTGRHARPTPRARLAGAAPCGARRRHRAHVCAVACASPGRRAPRAPGVPDGPLRSAALDRSERDRPRASSRPTT